MGSGFQDWLLKPLGQPSVLFANYTTGQGKSQDLPFGSTFFFVPSG